MDVSSTILRVGDYVALKHAKPNDGWLCAEGLISEELYLTKQTEDFINCLWEIHVQYQYSAIREYEIALTSDIMNFDLNEEQDNSNENKDEFDLIAQGGKTLLAASKNAEGRAIERLNNLHRAAINEQRLNEKIMSLKVGKALAYGDLIQLRHVKSKKFLTVSQYTLARQERENMRVMLQSRGDSSSCLLFMPRYKYDREGQHITSNMETFLRVHERPGEYIHAAKKNSYGYTDGRKEINCSLESSAWTICCYQQARDVKSKSIMAGQLVSLQDPDTSLYLTLDTLTPGVTTRAKVIMAPQFQIGGPISYENSVGTHLLWMIEKEQITVGGMISIHTDRITLRNLNTGLFIRSEASGLVAVRGRSNATVFECSCQSSALGFLQEDATVQLSTLSGQWITLQRAIADGPEAETKLCECSPDRFSAIPFLVSSSLLRSIGVDLFVAVQAAVSLSEFESATSLLMNGSDAGGSGVGTLVKSIFTLLECLLSFMSNEGISAGDEFDVLVEKTSKETIHRRQTMAREQGLLDVLLNIIALCELAIYDNVKAMYRRETSSIMVKQISGMSGGSVSNMRNSFHKSRTTSKLTDAAPERTRPAPSISENVRRLSVGALSILGGNANNNSVGGQRNSITGKRDSLKASESGKQQIISDAVTTAVKRSTNKDKNDTENVVHFTLSQEIAQACLKLIVVLVQGNHTSQMHIADRFPVILNQVRNQDYAVQCVKEMLKDNLLMLQTKVRKREIDIFVKLLKEFEMSVTFLKLIQSTCSCPMGVDNTQRMVTYALFGSEGGNKKKKSGSQSGDSSDEDVDDEDGESQQKPVLIRLHSNKPDHLMNRERRNMMNIDVTHNIYMPRDPELLSEVLGRALLVDGMPLVFASWNCEDVNSEFTMLHLFDTNSMVPLETLCNPIRMQKEMPMLGRGRLTAEAFTGSSVALDSSEHNTIGSTGYGHGHGHASGLTPAAAASNTGNASSSLPPSFAIAGANTNAVNARNARRRQSQLARTTLVMKRQKVVVNKSSSNYDLKMQVLNFLIAELYLIADLCLDRNYVAIETLESLFTYDTLVALLLSDDIPSTVKAPVCRILRCMYVDREPQVAAIFPRLIRTSVTLLGGQENSFQDHHMGSQYSFAVIQQVISEYIRTSLNGAKCDELSAELMDLLKTLINFGFYSTQQHIRDILNPLIYALDGHKQLRRNITVKSSLKSSSVRDVEKSEKHRDQRDYASFSLPVRVFYLVYDVVVSWVVRPIWHTLCCMRGSNRQNKYKDSQVLPAAADDVDDDDETFAYRLLHQPFSTWWKWVRKTFVNHHEHAWQRKFFDLSNTMSYLIAILVVVVVSVTVLLLQLFQSLQLPGFDIFVVVFFGIELLARMYCFRYVRHTLLPFFKDYYNWIDISLVTLDVVLMSVGAGDSRARAAQSIRAVRALRFLRLLRIFRAARLLKRIAEGAVNPRYRSIPSRYKNMSKYEAKTVVNILQIITMIYDRIQDQNLGIFIKAFVKWFDDENSNANIDSMQGVNGSLVAAKSPLDIYLETCQIEEDVSTQVPAAFDGVLIDMLMYSNHDIVESALNLLMVHKSKNQLLFEAATKTQIIYSPALESKYKFMTNTLRDMKRLAEKFEIWGELANTAHVQEANNIKKMLTELTDLIKVANEDTTLNIKVPFHPDVEVQNLLLNLNAVPCLMFLQETLYDGGRETPKDMVADILKACNELICWFVKLNPANQEVAFHHFAWFFDRIDNDIGSSMVLRNILQGNRHLIKQCSKKYISDTAARITSQSGGRKPMYLDMFLGMTEMSREVDCAVPAMENEISRHLTGREYAGKILLWCVPYNSKAYDQRRAEMEDIMRQGGEITEDRLTPSLKYHASLVTLLASCNLGPKLQAIYPFEDVVHTLADNSTIYPVKKALGLLLVEMITCGIDGAEYSEELWKFFDNCCNELEIIQGALRALFKDPSKTVLGRIRTGEWLNIILKVITLFFNDFELATFAENTFDNETSDSAFRATTRSEAVIESSIRRLFLAIKTIYQSHGSQLGTKLREGFKESCLALSHHFPNDLKFDPDNDDLSQKPAGQPGRRSILSFARGGGGILKTGPANDSVHMVRDSGAMVRSRKSSATDRPSIISTSRFLSKQRKHSSRNLSGFFSFRTKRDGTNTESVRNVQANSTTQSIYRQKYQDFTANIVSQFSDEEFSAVELFESIPVMRFSIEETDVYLESLLRKLTSHIRSRLRKTTMSRALDASSVSTTGWLLRTFRLMIEKCAPAVIVDNRIVEVTNSHVDLEKTEMYRNIFNECGVTHLCLDLLSVGIDMPLVVEAIHLLVMLLLVKGGNRTVQKTIHAYLADTDSVLFFEALKDIIDNLMVWCQKESEVVLRNKLASEAMVPTTETQAAVAGDNPEMAPQVSVDTKLPPEMVVFRLMQLMCDGNYLPAKNLFRDQDGNSRVANIIEGLAAFIDRLSRQETHLSTRIAINVIKTMLKLQHGPCKGNQEQFIMHTELLVSLNRLMRASRPSSQNFTAEWAADIEILRESIVDVLLAAIEGQSASSVVFERVATTVELNVFHVVLLPSVDSDMDAGILAELIEEYELTTLQAKYLVFLESLGDLRGTLPTFAQAKIGKDIASVEIVRDGHVTNVHFFVPHIVKDISLSSLTTVTMDIDCSAHERKLSHFLKNVSHIYREAKHQQFLRNFGISNLWSLQSRLTWMMFFNAVIMNCLILGYYRVVNGSHALFSNNDDGTFGEHATHYPTSMPTAHGGLHRKILEEIPNFLFNTHNSQMDFEMLAVPVTTSTDTRASSNNFFIESSVDRAIHWLSLLQLLLSAAVVVVLFIVRLPVRYKSRLEQGDISYIRAMMYTFGDPLPMWYSIYFIFTFLALVENRLFLSLLLLDFAILDPTTRHLLEAVKNPARQLVATLVIIIIVLNVFAGVVFYFYRTEVVGFDIYSMWESFKLGLSYGIRGEYGVSHEMTNTLGTRMIMDLAFYFIVLAILRHIFFAIIVDTFGKLREDKFERDQHANNSCFVCGVDRHDFDRIVVPGNNGGFAHHRAVVHNTLHYVYYIISIWQRPEEDDNGIEMHVRCSLRNRDISWFPMGLSHSSTTKHGQSHGVGDFSTNKLTDAMSLNAANSTVTAGHHSNYANHKPDDGAHGSGLARITSIERADGSKSGSDHDMVSHILHIEKQLNRIMGGAIGDSTKLKTDTLLSIHEHDDEESEDDRLRSQSPPQNAPISTPESPLNQRKHAILINGKQPPSESPMVSTLPGRQLSASLLSTVSQNPGQPPQRQTTESGVGSAQQQQQQPTISGPATTTPSKSHSEPQSTSTSTTMLPISVSSNPNQVQALTTMTSKISDISSVLRLVVNKLEKLELRSTATKKKRTKKTTRSSPSSNVRDAAGSMVSATSQDESDDFLLRGPSVAYAASVVSDGEETRLSRRSPKKEDPLLASGAS